MSKFLASRAGFMVPDFHVFFEDFDDYAATDWIITTVEDGSGSASEAVSDADDGILLVTNAAGANDYDAFQWAGRDASAVAETFTFTAGKRLWFEARFKVGDASSSNLVIGLHDTDTDPVANTISDGIYFKKDEDVNLDFDVVASSTATNVTALAELADDTWYKMAWYYNGKVDEDDAAAGAIQIMFVEDDTGGALLVPVGSAALTNAPSTELAVSFAIENGAAAAETLSLDYLYVAKER